MRSLKALLLSLVLLAAAALAAGPGARAGDESPVDVVFVIDGSGSMAWTDPSSFRRDGVKCFIDLIAEDVGGVAITQFAGWNETKARGDEVFPLTAMPKSLEALDSVLDLVKASIDKKIEPFGEATDFNRALGAGIAPVLKDVEKGKKAWVILFTDGEAFEVPEAAGVRSEYVDAAKAGGKDATSPEVLNAIAMEEYTTKTLPALNREEIFVTPILLTTDPASTAESPVLTPLVQQVRTPGRYLRSTKESLRSVFLEALASVPTTFLSSRATKAFDYKAEPGVKPKGDVAMKFHRFPFATMTRAVIFSESPALEIDVTGPDGKSVRSSPNVRVVGKGARYRVVSLNKFMPAGDYTVKISNGAAEPVTFEHLWYATIDARPKLEIPAKSYPGAPIPYTVSLLSPDGKVITDPAFLDGLECVVSMKKPGAEIQKVAPPKFGIKEALSKDEIILGEDVPFGEYEVTARFRALDGRYESSAVSAKTLVGTGVSIKADPAEGLDGMETTVTVSLSGRVVPKGLEVTLTDPKGTAKTLELTREGMARELKAKAKLEAPGEWKLAAKTADPGTIEVSTPTIKVGGRQITLLDKDGKKTDKITLTLKWDEKSEDTWKGTLKVDARAGEAPKLHLMGGYDGTSNTGGKVNATLPSGTSPDGAAPLVYTISQGDGGNWSDEGAGAIAFPLKVEATVGSSKVSREIPVTLAYPDKADKELKKLLKTILMIAIPLILLLLALLLFLYMRPRFDKHTIVAIGQQNEKMATHNIAQKIGLRGGNGPPECANILALLAKGRRGATNAELSAVDAKGTPLFVNGKPLEGKVALKNGDRITFEKGGTPYMYLYFTGDPPADLTPFLPPPLAPSLGDGEIIIEF